MNSLKLLLLLLSAWICLTGCSKQPESIQLVRSPLPFSPIQLDPKAFDQKIIQNLEIFVLKKGLNQERWKAVFDRITKMHHLRNQIRQSKKQEEASTTVDDAISQLSQIVIDLFETDSAFVLQWGALENCRIESLAQGIVCEPLDSSIGVNLLNVGMPDASGAWQILPPDLGRHEKTPSYTFLIRSVNTDWGQFTLRLRLKPEEIAENEIVLKGEVDVQTGSSFVRLGEPMEYEPIGYAELRLE